MADGTISNALEIPPQGHHTAKRLCTAHHLDGCADSKRNKLVSCERTPHGGLEPPTSRFAMNQALEEKIPITVERASQLRQRGC
jgi:hypothetical protein